jgi:hypothetical protein
VPVVYRINPDLAALWEKYLVAERYVPHVGSRLTLAGFKAAFANFYNWLPDGLDADEESMLTNPMDQYALSFKHIQIGDVSFSDEATNPARSWFMFPFSEDDHGVMYFGQIVRIITHVGPVNNSNPKFRSPLLQVKYFKSPQLAKQYDREVPSPVLSKKEVVQPWGNIWPADQVVPMEITVVENALNNRELLVLHKDLFFAHAGGHTGPDLLRGV